MMDMAVFPNVSSENCVTSGDWNCTRYKLCNEDTDNNIYPGRIKSLVHTLYVPLGLTPNASTYLETPSDVSVILSGAYLPFQDDFLMAEKKSYRPLYLTYGKLSRVSIQSHYDFGDMICSATYGSATADPTATPLSVTGDPCSYCIIKLAVEYIMASITEVSDNSTRLLKQL
ncbi:uncharacterized protein LOC117320911 [Pecten maximus]|uniref:uncharacterized protein LOC117320911 n=1 Tax=Pecten maximus TaxID=6579 RepID=UPI0014590F79|nr:uncharacterized protein LOC117320911 [Pecten maximus]